MHDPWRQCRTRKLKRGSWGVHSCGRPGASSSTATHRRPWAGRPRVGVDGAAARVEGCRASGKEQIRGVKRHQSVAERRERGERERAGPSNRIRLLVMEWLLYCSLRFTLPTLLVSTPRLMHTEINEATRHKQISRSTRSIVSTSARPGDTAPRASFRLRHYCSPSKDLQTECCFPLW